jgi:hypothetical protein
MLAHTTIDALAKRGLHLVDINNTDVQQKIVALRRDRYTAYKSIREFEFDMYDQRGIVLYGCSGTEGAVTSSARIAFPCARGLLPDESWLRPALEVHPEIETKSIAEIGRFAIAPNQRSALGDYFAAFYLVGKDLGVTFVFMTARETANFYLNFIGADILNFDISENFGGEKPFVAFAWNIENSTPAFKRWINLRG